MSSPPLASPAPVRRALSGPALIGLVVAAIVAVALRNLGSGSATNDCTGKRQDSLALACTQPVLRGKTLGHALQRKFSNSLHARTLGAGSAPLSRCFPFGRE